MPGRIQAQPVGFLNLFGLKTTGQAPAFMADSVAPVVDVRKLYELPLIDVQRANDSFEGGGADEFAYFGSHQTNLRRVYALSLEAGNILNTTGNYVTLAPVIQGSGAPTNTNYAFIGAPFTWTASTTSVEYGWGITFSQPVDVAPGARIGFRMLDTNEGNPMPVILGMLRAQIPI